MKDYTSLRAVLNNEKISTVVHAKDVNRNGVLFSLLQLLQFCPDTPRVDIVAVLSVVIRFWNSLPCTSAVLWIRRFNESSISSKSGSRVLMTKN
jgi:hypothetical protein